STSSLVSNTTVSFCTSLNNSAARKDFQTVFASLQSTYGLGGVAPSPAQKTARAVPSPAMPAPLQAINKNLESAFADLQSTYGFGG
ncbi:hypothetical protein B0H14DRAFT_2272294, partial [Mycena olivaceomarginata]